MSKQLVCCLDMRRIDWQKKDWDCQSTHDKDGCFIQTEFLFMIYGDARWYPLTNIPADMVMFAMARRFKKDLQAAICESGPWKQRCRDLFADAVVKHVDHLDTVFELAGTSWMFDFENTATARILAKWPRAKAVCFEKDSKIARLIAEPHHQPLAFRDANLQVVEGAMEDETRRDLFCGARAVWFDLCGPIDEHVMKLFTDLVTFLMPVNSILAITINAHLRQVKKPKLDSTHRCHVDTKKQVPCENFIQDLRISAGKRDMFLAVRGYVRYGHGTSSDMNFIVMHLTDHDEGGDVVVENIQRCRRFTVYQGHGGEKRALVEPAAVAVAAVATVPVEPKLDKDCISVSPFPPPTMISSSSSSCSLGVNNIESLGIMGEAMQDGLDFFDGLPGSCGGGDGDGDGDGQEDPHLQQQQQQQQDQRRKGKGEDDDKEEEEEEKEEEDIALAEVTFMPACPAASKPLAGLRRAYHEISADEEDADEQSQEPPESETRGEPVLKIAKTVHGSIICSTEEDIYAIDNIDDQKLTMYFWPEKVQVFSLIQRAKSVDFVGLLVKENDVMFGRSWLAVGFHGCAFEEDCFDPHPNFKSSELRFWGCMGLEQICATTDVINSLIVNDCPALTSVVSRSVKPPFVINCPLAKEIEHRPFKMHSNPCIFNPRPPGTRVQKYHAVPPTATATATDADVDMQENCPSTSSSLGLTTTLMSTEGLCENEQEAGREVVFARVDHFQDMDPEVIGKADRLTLEDVWKYDLVLGDCHVVCTEYPTSTKEWTLLAKAKSVLFYRVQMTSIKYFNSLDITWKAVVFDGCVFPDSRFTAPDFLARSLAFFNCNDLDSVAPLEYVGFIHIKGCRNFQTLGDMASLSGPPIVVDCPLYETKPEKEEKEVKK
jgi:hypothetical protein